MANAQQSISMDACPRLPTVQNIVSAVNLGCKIDLKQVAAKALNSEYNPKRFSAVIMRIKSPKTTALIFDSGKVVVTGAKTEEESKNAAKKFARIIQKLGFPARFIDFKIENVVASSDLGFIVRLEKFACSDHAKYTTYEPELFPGLVYRNRRSKIVVLIFVSGKIVIAGAKNIEEVYNAFKNIYPVAGKTNTVCSSSASS